MTQAARLLSFTLLAAVFGVAAAVRGQAPEPSAPEDAPASEIQDGTPQELFVEGDVHVDAGLDCASCHGAGEPTAIARLDIAQMCASCHSDAEYMQAAVVRIAREAAEQAAQEAAEAAAAAGEADGDAEEAVQEGDLEDEDDELPPPPPVDQYEMWQQSRHGQNQAEGEDRTATCSDCHRPHGLAPIGSPDSLVSPLRIVDTCGRCHGDMELMEEFFHFENPAEDWRTSVHATAMFEGGDLSAPTCATCHGAHNANRPETMDEKLAVCAECHVREADLYVESAHKIALDDMEEAGCVTCHGNHAIESPTEEMIGLHEEAVCYTCHDDQMPGVEMIEGGRAKLVELDEAIGRAEAVLGEAEVAGMLVDEGLLVLRGAVQQQILSRVAMHTFELEPIVEQADTGIASAVEAEQYGHDALAELQYRRRGLAVATLVIVGFLITLGVTIRRLPPVTKEEPINPLPPDTEP